MTAELQPADYVLLAVMLTAAVTGLFRGFSGTLAFALAVAGAVAVGTLTWRFSEGLALAVWLRGGLTLLAALLAFGLARLLVKKIVNGLLAQPSDAIFGMALGCAFAAVLLLLWAWSGKYLEYSTLAKSLASHL